VSDMVEQVARALCAARYNALEGHYLPAFKQAQVEKHWQLFVDDASIAIEAMRKPTEKMLNACNLFTVDGRIAVEKDYWQAMIDAALNGTKSTT